MTPPAPSTIMNSCLRESVYQALRILSSSIFFPSSSAATSGARGLRKRYGFTLESASCTFAAFIRLSASEGTNFPARMRQPVSAGFITPTSTPRELSADAMPVAIYVFPTPVSVPVIKTPFSIIFLHHAPCPLRPASRKPDKGHDVGNGHYGIGPVAHRDPGADPEDETVQHGGLDPFSRDEPCVDVYEHRSRHQHRDVHEAHLHLSLGPPERRRSLIDGAKNQAVNDEIERRPGHKHCQNCENSPLHSTFLLD